jgi:hypothetical protein
MIVPDSFSIIKSSSNVSNSYQDEVLENSLFNINTPYLMTS